MRRVSLDSELILKFLEPQFQEILTQNYLYAVTECRNILDSRAHILIKTSNELRAAAERELGRVKDMLKTTFGAQIQLPPDEMLRDQTEKLISKTLSAYKSIVALVC